MWNVATGDPLGMFLGAGDIERVAVSADASFIAACSSHMPEHRQGTTVWELATGRRLQILREEDEEGSPAWRPCSVALGSGRPPHVGWSAEHSHGGPRPAVRV